MPETKSNTAVPRRKRWWQFSLATMLILTAIAAVVLGLWTDSARRQKRAVLWIEEQGGFCGYSYQMKPPFNLPPPGPAWLRDWLGIDYLDYVQSAHLEDESVTDADLARLAKDLPRLTRLQIAYAPKVTDAGLAQLESFQELESLGLDCPQMTDAAMAHLERLHRLDSVGLGSDHVTDAGLARLRALKRLYSLRLECPVTDAGMEHLTELKELIHLRCRGPASDKQLRKVVRVLTETSAAAFRDEPLSHVIAFFADYHDVKFHINEEAIAAAQLDPSMPVTANTTGLSLAETLDAVLHAHDLGWYVGDDEIVITTAEIDAERHAGINKLRGTLPKLKNVEFSW